MKTFVMALTALALFSGCNYQSPDTQEEEAEKELIKKSNIISGSGSYDDPYVIKNGVYGSLENGTSSYTFDLAGNNCSVLFYDYNSSFDGNYSIRNTSLDSGQLQRFGQSSETFTSRNSLESGKHIVTIGNLNGTSDEFGVYSSCIDDDYNLTNLTNSTYDFSTYSKLYSMDLNTTKLVNISSVLSVQDVSIFNSDMILQNVNPSVFENMIKLDAGTYYYLVNNTSVGSKAIFDVDFYDINNSLDGSYTGTSILSTTLSVEETIEDCIDSPSWSLNINDNIVTGIVDEADLNISVSGFVLSSDEIYVKSTSEDNDLIMNLQYNGSTLTGTYQNTDQSCIGSVY